MEENNSFEPDQNKSMVQIKVGNRLFDAVRDPRCNVCKHPARFSIEEQILLNHSYLAIARWVSDREVRQSDGSIEYWPKLDSRSIKNHFQKGHCPMDAEMMRAFSERRAEELGEDLENSMTQFVDHVVVQKAVLAKGYEALQRGEIAPDVKDTLAASKLLSDWQKDQEGQASVEQWQEAMTMYFQAVRQVVSQEQWVQIVNRVQNHPVMKAIEAKRTIEAN